MQDVFSFYKKGIKEVYKMYFHKFCNENSVRDVGLNDTSLSKIKFISS